MAIILHVRFSMRSWFGNCVFVLLYSFQICVAKGSCFCISAGLPRPALAASSFQSGKNDSQSKSLRVFRFSFEGSRLAGLLLSVFTVGVGMVECCRRCDDEWCGCLGLGVRADCGETRDGATRPELGPIRVSISRLAADAGPPRGPVYCAVTVVEGGSITPDPELLAVAGRGGMEGSDGLYVEAKLSWSRFALPALRVNLANVANSRADSRVRRTPTARIVEQRTIFILCSWSGQGLPRL